MITRGDNRRFWRTVMLPFGFGYFVTLIYRSVNAVLAHPLITELDLNSAELGLLTSMFVLGTAAAQLPLGVLLDTWGARRTQALFFSIGAAGIFLFSASSGTIGLASGRALLGIGMAGGLMSAFKEIADYVDAEEIPVYNGIIMGFGGLGVLTATMPSKLFEVAFGWRALCVALGVLTLLAAAVIVSSGRDRKTEAGGAGLSNVIAGLAGVYGSRDFWRLAPLLAVANGGFIAFQGLWAGPWLQHVEGRSPIDSAHILLFMAIATIFSMVAGGPLARLSRVTGYSLTMIAVLCIAVHILVQTVIAAGVLPGSLAIWIAYGFFGQVVLVLYAVIAQRFGPSLAGRAMTAANVLVFFYAFAAQFAFGLIVHLWPTTHVHPTEGYRVALFTSIAIESAVFLLFVAQALAGSSRRAA
jgi:predicted MFS family arabinose efflux permease